MDCDGHRGNRNVLPSATATAQDVLAAAGMSGDKFLQLVRERERYNWLADKMSRWVGLYSVPELVSMLESAPSMPGQHQKALVALSLNDDLSALMALEDFDSSEHSDTFQLLHEIALGEWRQRYRSQS